MICIQLHGKRNLEDTYLTFLSYIPTPDAFEFDESHTQGPDTITVPRSYFHDSNNGQNREIRPISNPSVPQISTPTSKGQSQDNETTIDQTQNDNTKHIYDSTIDTPTTLEVNNPTIEKIPPTEPSHSRGGKYHLRPNTNPNYSEIDRY